MSLDFNEVIAVQLLEGLPEALMVIVPEGEVVFFNRAAEEITGYSPAEVVGKHVSLLLPQSERRRLDVVTWLQRWALHPDPEQLRYLYLDGLTKRGDARLYRVRASLLQGSGNDADRFFVIVFRDITEEHQSTVQLRHQQLVNNRIMAIGEDAILSIDESGKICFWNRKATEIFGYQSEEAIGQSLDIILPKGAGEDHKQLVKSFASGQVPSRLMGDRGEITGRRKDGRIVPLEAAITKTSIDDKIYLSAQIRDISKRKEMEIALRISEERFRVVFQNAFEAMALLDSDGKVLEINRAGNALLPKGQHLGKLFWDLEWWINITDAKEVESLRDNLRADVESVKDGTDVRSVVHFVTNDGQTREMDFSLNPVVDDEGKVTHIIAEGRDLTELRS